jgi:multidrug/hemolysin transport system ATP-binding protein
MNSKTCEFLDMPYDRLQWAGEEYILENLLEEAPVEIGKIKYSKEVLRIISSELETIADELRKRDYKAEIIADMLTVTVQNSMEAYALLKEYEGRYTSFEVIRGTMDDVFINITGRSIREDI